MSSGSRPVCYASIHENMADMEQLHEKMWSEFLVRTYACAIVTHKDLVSLRICRHFGSLAAGQL